MYIDNRRIVVLFLLLVAFTVSSCAVNKMYSGPELPRDKIALIKPTTGVFGPAAFIAAVDGKKPGFNDALIGVEPGKHTVAVRFHKSRGMYVPPFTVLEVHSFECEAGHKYVAHAGWLNGTPTTWIEDAKTKKVVSGRKPE